MALPAALNLLANVTPMFTHKIPFYYLFITAVAGVLISYLIFQQVGKKSLFEAGEAAVIATQNKACESNFERLRGYKYIKPLMLATQNCEADRFGPVKSDLMKQIDGFTNAGVVSKVSVYLRDLKNDEWMAINADEAYDPGSLMKVPLMITFLRMAEEKPGLLDAQLAYDKPFSNRNRNPVFVEEGIALGNKYTIRELIRRMIEYSDNEATNLLCTKVDFAVFQKTFTDFGFQPVDTTQMNYPLTAREYSAFLEGLYNAGYLTIQHSEYANSLLTNCKFKQGILTGLPDSITVAHKFGEAGNDDIHELHESGIVYYNNSPYLITVMTRGKDVHELPQVLGAISKTVFAYMQRDNS